MNLALQTAQNPATAPEQLRRLASHQHSEVRRAVAANPNTPEEVLMRLAAHFPEEILGNPVLDLLLVVNPNFVAEMPEYARNRLLAHPKLIEGFMRWAAKNGDVNALLSLLQNPSTPTEIVEALQSHHVLAVAEAAQMHRSLEASPLEAALWWADAPCDTFELRGLVMSGLLPAWLAPRLVREPDTLLRQSLAESPYSTDEVLEALLFDEDEDVRKAARANPKLAARSLELLAWLEGKESRRKKDKEQVFAVSPLLPSVAMPPSPKDVAPLLEFPPLEVLAKGHTWMRQLVARHPQVDGELLERFANDDDWRVRAAVAQNGNLPMGFLQALSRDLDRDVRMAVAARTDAPVEVLEYLAADEQLEVREVVRANPSAPTEWLGLLERLQADDADLKVTELQRLSQHGHWARKMVAAHPQVSAEVLEICRQEGDWGTRMAVARNPKASPDLLQVMASDPDPEVRQAVAAHSSTPLETLELLFSDDQPDVRVQIALNPRTPQELLFKLSKDEHWKVRQASASNPAASAELLQGLSLDPDRDVRQAVAENPNVPEAALEPLFVGWPSDGLNRKSLYHQLTLLQPVPLEWLSALSQGDEWARRLAAKHPATLEECLWKLASDEDWRVRVALSSNRALSPDILYKLAQDTDGDVRRAVVVHPQVGDLALDRLATDEQPDVRQQVALHPNASSFALGFLLGDEDEGVRAEANRNPNTLPETKARFALAEASDGSLELEFLEGLTVGNVYSRTLAAKNPSTPPDLLRQLVQDTDWRVRVALAANPNLGEHEVQILVGDTDHEVRQTLAKNPKVSQEVLARLLSDLDENTRLNALRHANLDQRTLETHRARLLVQASRSRYPLNRALALSCTELPLQELCKIRHRAHPEWLVRYALTQNLSTPDALLEELERDGNQRVSKAAGERRRADNER